MELAGDFFIFINLLWHGARAGIMVRLRDKWLARTLASAWTNSVHWKPRQTHALLAFHSCVHLVSLSLKIMEVYYLKSLFRMDGWLAILRPFQQDFSHVRTMGGWQWKAVCSGTPLTFEKISIGAGLELGTARSVGQRLTQRATGTPRYSEGLESHWHVYNLN